MEPPMFIFLPSAVRTPTRLPAGIGIPSPAIQKLPSTSLYVF